MAIRRQLDLGTIRRANICITQIDGYPHTEAFREVAERIEAECRSHSIDCSTANKIDKTADINYVLGAHLKPLSYINDDPKRLIIVNLERLNSLKYGENFDLYLKLIDTLDVIDFSSTNVEFYKRKELKEPIYIYRPWHDPIWIRVQAEPEKEWDTCFIGSLTPRREKLINLLQHEGISVKTAFNCYSAERDEILAKSRIALNIHAYEDSADSEIWRLGYYIANKINIVSENCFFEEGEDSINKNLVQSNYDDLVQAVKDELKKIENYDYERRQTEILFSAAALCSRKNDNNYLNDKSVSRPLILNIGCGQDWHEDALNIDIKETGTEDLVLDISQPWKNINTFHDTQRFGLVHLSERSFDIIEASCVLEHVKNLTLTLQNIAKLLKPGGWLFLRFPHQDSLGAWQDPTHVRGMNEHLFKYLNEWSEYIELGDIKLRPKWISFIEEDNQNKINKQDSNRMGFVEAITVKEVVSGPKRQSHEQIEELKESRKKVGGTCLRDKINRRTFIETYEANTVKTKLQNLSQSTVSLLTPTFGQRFRYLQCASKWIASQDYPLSNVEWVILTDTDDEAEFLRTKLMIQHDKPGYQINIQSAGEKLKIGAKRNLIHKYCEGNILINIDDDDYYMPSRISHCIERLNKSDADYAGCRYLPVYFTDDNTLWMSDPGENVACAGSFAYKRELLKKTWYPPNAVHGEEIGFTNDFSLKKVDLDAFSTMICIAHKQNTFDKHKLRDPRDGGFPSFETRSQKVHGSRNFFNAGGTSLRKDDFQAEWKSVYQQIENNSDSLDLIEEFFCCEKRPTILDNFANSIIDRLK